jgi:DNA N-6-adenine-methyltransferase Dam
MKYHEKAVGQSSEWRTGPAILDPIGLQYGLDPCAPLDGYYCVPALRRFTIHDNGLAQSWRGRGLAFVNPPWSLVRRGVVPWLRKFYEEADGGIFVCVARTSCDWFHELVWPHSERSASPTAKLAFINPMEVLARSRRMASRSLARGQPLATR